MITVSAERMERLLKAAELAREPGACRYERDGSPCCIVAQLAVLEDPATVTPFVLRRWDQASEDSTAGGTVDELEDWVADEVLEPYDRETLAIVQAAWDIGEDEPGEARRRLVAAILQHYAAEAS